MKTSTSATSKLFFPSINFRWILATCLCLGLFSSLSGQTAFIGMNQYAFQYQPGGAPTLVGLFFNSTDSRFEFRDAAGAAELFVNPISQFSNFRGKLGINNPSPAVSLHVNGTSRLGGPSNYAEFDASGNLRFYGTSRYIVPGNTYAFQALSSTIGLYFNQTLNRFEFLNSSGTPALTLGAAGTGTGNMSITGEMTLGGASGQAKLNAVSTVASLQAAVRGRGVNDFTGGYLGVLGANSFDGSGLAINGNEIGVLGISAGSTSGLTDNYGVFGYSDNAGVRGEHSSGNYAELGRSDFALLATGPSRLAGMLTADAAEMTSLYVRNGLDPSAGVDGPLLVGTTGGFRLSVYESAVQTANGLGASTLDLNPFGGNVNIAQGGGTVNLASTGGGSVNVATGGGNVNLSTIFFTDFPSKRVGVRDATPEYTLTVRHPTGTLTQNGIAVVNELNNTTWHLYSFVDGDFGLFNADSLKGTFDNVSGMYMSTSDARLKSGIADLSPVSERLMELQPRSYSYRSDRSQGMHYGFIAQELERVFPELVHQDGETGLRTVSYTELIPLVIAAWQEEHKTAVDQTQHFRRLEERLSDALDRIDELELAMSACCAAQGSGGVYPSGKTDVPGSEASGSSATLGQNIPNPFSGYTEIPYYLPEGTPAAEIRIMDLEGRIIDRLALAGYGAQSVRWQHKAFPDGLYLYGLFIGGRPVQMREMQLIR